MDEIRDLPKSQVVSILKALKYLEREKGEFLVLKDTDIFLEKSSQKDDDPQFLFSKESKVGKKNIRFQFKVNLRDEDDSYILKIDEIKMIDKNIYVDTSLEFPVFKIGDRVVDKCENFGNIIDIDYNEKKYFVKLDYYPDNIKHCDIEELDCLLIRDYKKLATYYNTDKKMGYVGTCLLSLNDSCLDFVSEWKSISENPYLHGLSQTDYYPFHEETAINITYWKRGITENYGRIYVNTLYSDVVKHVEEDDNILNENIFENPNQKCVDSSKIQFYHGIVNKEELDKVLEYLES
jgi:hypothetical protein